MGQHGQLGLRDAPLHGPGHVGRRQRVGLAHDDQGGHGDPGQFAGGVGPVLHGLQGADEPGRGVGHEPADVLDQLRAFGPGLLAQQAAQQRLDEGGRADPCHLVLLVGAALEDLGGVGRGPGVGEDQARDPLRVLAQEGEGHVAAHRQPAQHHPPQAQPVEQAGHQVGVAGHGVAVHAVRGAGAAEAEQVGGDHPPGRREVLDLGRPHAGVQREGVEQHERRLAAP